MGNKSSKKSKSKNGKKGGGGGGSEKSAPVSSQAKPKAQDKAQETTTNGSSSNGAKAASSSGGSGEKETKAVAASSGSGSDTSSSEDENDWGDEPTLLTRTGQKVCQDDFELLTVIGKGSFGKVMQVRKKDDGHIYAMKVLRKEAIIARKQVAHTRAEKAILQKIQHPFIVNLNFAFQTEDKLYMILDYINGGELFFHLKKEGNFSEERVRIYAAEIILALAHLHSFDIVYRDLKPENILLDSEGHICITDFGLSKEITSEEGTHTFCGTPEYLAPEVLKGQGHGTAVDWWSLGTLVFEMLTGLPPFYSQNINIMYQKILNGELRFPPSVSPEAQSLLEGLLTRDPEKRLGANSSDDSAADIKAHPFFASIDWDALERKDVEPPFKPAVKSETDTSQIDTVFTTETPVDSLVEKSAISDAVNDDDLFEGFTFAPKSALDGGQDF